MKTLRVIVVSLFGSFSAFAGSIFYSSDFSSTTGWSAQMNPSAGVGGTLQTSTPFSVGTNSMGSYISATYYPTTLVNPASVASSPSVWLGFLVRNESGLPWLTGVTVNSGTNNYEVQYHGPWLGQVGSESLKNGANKISFINGNWNGVAGNSYTLLDGQAVAVLARFYDTGATGNYNTGDLWVQSDLSQPLFSSVTSANAVVSGYFLGNVGVSTIRSLRLAGEGTGVQSFDNIVLADNSGDAIHFMSTGSVPEPSAFSLLAIGMGGWVALRRVRRKAD